MALLSSPSLAKLIANVRNFLSQPNSANSTWTDLELTEYLNEAVRMYFVEVTHSNEGLFSPAPVDLNIVSGVETVALPTDCFQIRNLEKKTSSGYVPLDYINSQTLSYETIGSTSGETFLPSYFLQSNNIVLRPIPNFSETAGLRLHYVAFPDTMINGGDLLTAQVSPIFKQLIEARAVYLAKLKESLVNGVAMHKVAEENMANIYVMFKEAIHSRSRTPQFTQAFNP